MNLEETNAFLAWVNQHDPLVSNTMSSVDIWQAALYPYTIAEARQAILDHYRTNDNQPANPGTVRKRCGQLRNTAEAKQRAIESPAARVPTHPNGWRARNPERWDALFAQGREQANREREQIGGRR